MSAAVESKLIQLRLETTRHDLDEDVSVFEDPLIVDSIEPLPRPPHIAPLTEARFIEVIAVVVVAAVSTMATRVVERWLRDKSQGVMIDVRSTPALVSRVAGIPAGFLVLIDKDGSATTHEARPDQGEPLAAIVRSALTQA